MSNSSLNPAFRQSYAIAMRIPSRPDKEAKKRCILAWCIATKKALAA